MLLVCGGRSYHDARSLWCVLEAIHFAKPVTMVITGVATDGSGCGADQLGDEWARSRRIRSEAHPAEWSLGRSAGPIRNGAMARRKPDLVAAFEGGRGTLDMMRQADAEGCTVLRIVGTEMRAIR